MKVSTSPFQLSSLYYILSAQPKLQAAEDAFQQGWASFHSVWHTVYVKKLLSLARFWYFFLFFGWGGSAAKLRLSSSVSCFKPH